MDAPPPVERPFGLTTATALVVGGMVGSGIFLLPASLAPYGWTGVLAWIVSTAGALCIGYVLVRLAAAHPEASGGIAAIGAVLGPLPAVLIGWAYWVSVWCANAAIATSAVSYLSVFLPGLSATPLTGALSAAGTIWLLTLLNLGGARLAGGVQVVTTVLKLLPLVAVAVILALIAAQGRFDPPPMPPPAPMVGALTAPIALTLFALVGFEAASLAAARVRDPARNVFRATMFGTALTGLLYIVVCSGIVLALPTATVMESPAPFVTFVATFWGTGPSLAVAAFAAIAALGALNGWVLIQGEVPRSMAAEGMLPSWFARTDRRDVPVGVLLLASGLGSALVMMNAAKSLEGIFAFMALLTTASNLWLYAGACIAAIVRRIALPAAILGLAFTGWAMWGTGAQISALSLALMLTAVPLYLMRRR